jgi:hypothetical protein
VPWTPGPADATLFRLDTRLFHVHGPRNPFGGWPAYAASICGQWRGGTSPVRLRRWYHAVWVSPVSFELPVAKCGNCEKEKRRRLWGVAMCSVRRIQLFYDPSNKAILYLTIPSRIAFLEGPPPPPPLSPAWMPMPDQCRT